MTVTAKILVVDDDDGVRFYLGETLARDGHEVTAVESGQAAMDQITSQQFDLALIDLKLKDMDGTEVLSTLRRQSPQTVAIMLTGHGTLETAVEALRQGAHDYLFKPCKTVELRESIRTGLLKRQQELRLRELVEILERHMGGQTAGERSEPASAQPASAAAAPAASAQEETRFLQRGRLVVDFMRHVITLDGHLLELSPTEYDLLTYLISAAPRVVSPKELVREVQGYQCEPWEVGDTLRYHIYRLRQKIRLATGQEEVIQTRRGVGYTIKE
ncbi:MAG TPA: response regulator transcription factor [Anaerolineales bacterium]|nr:response regulator transcription factor [Anaerolineales bacterium]